MGDAQTIEKPVQGKMIIRLPEGRFTEEQFFEFCMLNKDLRIEREANGKINVMSPTSSIIGRWNARISGQLFNWNEKLKLGEVFDSSSGFTMPDSAVLSPDASWISNERWGALDKTQQNTFAAICPDFIIELRSGSDSLQELRDKMTEYINNGCRLAWLIDPAKNQTMVYLPDGSVQVVPFAQKLDGGEVLPGFEIILADVIAE